MKSAPSLAALEKEIADIEREVSRLEHAKPPLATRIAKTIDGLHEAEAHFHRHGFGPIGVTPDQRAHSFRMATIGALMTIGGDAIMANERKRLEAEAAGEGNIAKMSEADRTQRVAELTAKQRQLRAARELRLRERETVGEIVERDIAAPEFFLATMTSLEAIAKGQEAT